MTNKKRLEKENLVKKYLEELTCDYCMRKNGRESCNSFDDSNSYAFCGECHYALKLVQRLFGVDEDYNR